MLFCPKCIFARFVNCGIFKLCNCVFVWFVGFDHSELCFCKNYSIVFLLPCLFSEICWCHHVQNKIAIFVIVITQRLYHTKCIYELSLLVFLKVFFLFQVFRQLKLKICWFGWFMVLCATFNNISVISWRSLWLVEETRENHRPVASHWQTLSQNVVLPEWDSNSQR